MKITPEEPHPYQNSAEIDAVDEKDVVPMQAGIRQRSL
jgi:hypothetical protein